MNLPPFIQGLLYLCALFLLSAALGQRVLRWSGKEINLGSLRAVFEIGLGIGALQFLPFLLFSAGIGSPAILSASVGVLGLLLVPDLLIVFRRSRQWLDGLPRLEGWERILLGITFLFLLSVFFHATCPVIEIDSLMYHLTSSRRYLSEGSFVHLVSITPTNFPLGVNMLHSVMLSFDNDAPVSVISFAFGLLTMAALYAATVTSNGRFVAATSAGILFVHTGFWLGQVGARIDIGLTAFTTLAVISLHQAMQERSAAHWWWLSACFAGLAASAKMQGAWVVGALVLVVLVARSGLPVRDRLRRSIMFILIAGLGVSPWLVKTWVLTGNPFYPLIYDLFGGTEWTSHGAERYLRSFVMDDPPLVLRASGFPGESWYWVRASLGVVLVGAGYLVSRTGLFRIPLLFAALYHLLLSVGSPIMLDRFVLPAFPGLALWAAPLWARWTRSSRLLLCFGAVFWLLYVNIAKMRIQLLDAFMVSAGIVSGDEFRAKALDEYDVVRFANENLPDDSRLLDSTEKSNTASFRFPVFWARCWEQDSFHFDSMERLDEDIRRIGITHIIVSRDYTRQFHRIPSSKMRIDVEVPMVTRYAESKGRILYDSESYALYELEPRRPRAVSQGS